VTPERSKEPALLKKVKALLKKFSGVPFHVMLAKLNSVLRGWTYAHRHVVAKDLMGRMDCHIFERIRHWLRKEYPAKTWAWLSKRYRKRFNGRRNFGEIYLSSKRKLKSVHLFRLADLPIRYHTKIRAMGPQQYRGVNATLWHLTYCI